MQTHPSQSLVTVPDVSKPFLKWVGGKSRLLSQLLPALPRGKRLIEPFVGSGAVFLAASYDAYVINDANSDLVAMWSALQCRPREFSEYVQTFFVEANRNAEAYTRVRAELNLAADRYERAVRLLYLNKFGFNGLFRVNSRGEFNVPYGHPSKLPLLAVDEMAAAAVKLERTLVLGGGFAAAIDLADAGDVVYCDPPYLDSTAGKSFTKYVSSGFGLAEHRLLLKACLEAAGRGAHVVISNHDTPETRELYQDWQLHGVSVRRSVAANGASRGVARELLAIYSPPACGATRLSTAIPNLVYSTKVPTTDCIQ